MFYGEANHHPDGSFIATEWITAAYIPLIPLRSFRLRWSVPSGNPFDAFKDAFAGAAFEVLDELPICWSQVRQIYAISAGIGIWYATATWLFFFKFNLFELFLSHPIAAAILFVVFLAALVTPFAIVQAVRRRSRSAAGAEPQDFGARSHYWQKLRPAQKILVFVVSLIFILPPMIVGLLNLPPASWINAKQSGFFGDMYSPQLTFLLLALVYLAVLLLLLLALSSTVKLLTGKKLFELFGKPSAGESQQREPPPPAPTPPSRSVEVFVTHCHMCNYTVPADQQRSSKTCPDCGADLSRRRH